MEDLKEAIRIEEAINKNGFIITNIKGSSMLPLFDMNHDLIRIEKTNEPLKKDDMALFKRDEKLVLHRVIDVKEDYYEICGDNRKAIEKVPFKNILGKVTAYYKDGRLVNLDDEEYLDYLNNLEKDISKREILYYKEDIPEIYIDTLKLIRAVIHDKEFNEDVDYEKLYSLCDRHMIVGYTFPKINKDICPNDIYKKWEDAYNVCIQRKLLFDNERNQILKIFKENNLKYLLFKGSINNEFYPSKNIRQFADNDILVSDKEKAASLMKERGYKTLRGSICIPCYKDFYNFELHDNLFEEKYNLPYFDNYFSKAIKDEKDDNLYHVTNEDYYVYLLGHFNKHYKNGGTGIRHFLDFYYVKEKLKIDSEKTNKIIEECNLTDFHKQVLELIDIFFNETKDLPINETNYVFSGTTYGRLENLVNNRIDRMGKKEYFMSRLFPPLSHLRSGRYTILKKHPYLLPFVYIYRLITLIFSKKTFVRVKNEFKIILNHGKQDD